MSDTSESRAKSPGSEVFDLGPHNNMTPEECLDLARRERWSAVMVIGYHEDGPELIVRSSAMDRAGANWLIDHAKLHAMDRL